VHLDTPTLSHIHPDYILQNLLQPSSFFSGNPSSHCYVV